ncbi:MAG TPA: DUF1559 domain-containing protein [Gemmata sp.]
MPSFKVQCPSCEAPVLIKNPNLVGTKVECPKCKYRFKVEEPAAESGAAKEKDKKADKADKAKKPKAPGGKNKKLVPVIAGVVALAVLVGGGVAFFGGDSKKKPPTGSPRTNGPTGTTGTTDPEQVENKDKKKTNPVAAPPVPKSTRVTSNLLPGQTVAVYRLNLDLMRNSPVYGALVDQPVSAMFRDTLGFTPDDVTAYVHCFAGDGRDPFGVVKLKNPVKAPDLLARMPLKPAPKTVKGHALYEFRTAPVLHAIANALAMRSLFGDMYVALPKGSERPLKEKPYGVCVYDTQHVLVGDHALLERYLGELAENGYPPFKSELDTTALAPTPAPMSPDAMPMPAPMEAQPKEAPKPPAKQSDPNAMVQSYTRIDEYRTIDPELKIALDDFEADRTAPPLLVYAERFDARQYDPKLMKKDYQVLATTLDPIASGLQFVSANVTAFGFRQLVGHLRLKFTDKDFAHELGKEKLSPGLATVTELLKLLLTTKIDFRDSTAPGAMLPGTGTQPGMGPGFPPGMGPAPYPPGMGSSFPPPGMGSSFPPPGMGSSMGPRPGPPGIGEGPGRQPGPMGPGSMGPIGPGPSGQGASGEPEAASHIDLFHRDRELFVTVDLTWSDTAFRTVIAPRLFGVANQIKGKMAVFSADSSYHALAAVAPKALNGGAALPPGTFKRAKTDRARLGLEHPPIQRVSLFADLLPYLGRGGLAAQVNKNLAWYDEKNLAAGGAWVPELLVPSYPQSAWRATSEYAPDHVFGATNYVAISGTGLDSAREDPNTTDPNVKKRLGMTGYNWGSRAEDVTDGLANTIYMMQTPPTTLSQPWIAGGGATVRGFNEEDPMSGFRHTNGGKPGTYALMGDGSVRFIPANIDRKVLLALGTRAGGDLADLADVNSSAPLVDPPKPPKAEVKKGPDAPVKPDPNQKVEQAPPPREKK